MALAVLNFAGGLPQLSEIPLIPGGIKDGEFKDPETGMEFLFIKGGCFEMGDGSEDADRDERLVHEVCVDDFYIGKHEVTQEQWKKVMNDNPSFFKKCGDNCPVENISWNNAQEFVRKLNEKTTPAIPLNKSDNPLLFPLNKGQQPSHSPLTKGEKRGLYRLPTEAEWEYAARSGGKKEKWAGTNNESELKYYAWCGINSGSKTRPAGKRKPNGAGLYDMSGNVWEWVQDKYDEEAYRKHQTDNPVYELSGSRRVYRGGGWLDNNSRLLRTTNRGNDFPVSATNEIGFRLVRIP